MLQTLKPKSLADFLQRLRSTKTRWLIYLTLGLLTTIIVSWTCAYFVEATAGPSYYLGPTRQQLPYLEVFHQKHFGSHVFWAQDVLYPEDIAPTYQNIRIHKIDGFPRWTRIQDLHTSTTMHRNGYGKIHTDIANGWPFLALSNTFDISMLGRRNNRSIEIKYGIDLGPFNSSRPESRRILPLKPIIPGFIINTIFYTLTLFAIPTFAFQKIRYHHRLAKSHCPTCNYDLRNNPAPRCPECGQTNNQAPPPPPSPTTTPV